MSLPALPLVRLGAATATVCPVTTVSADRLRASLVLRGEIDVSVAADLAAEFGGHLDAGRRFLRADCAAVEFLDSTVLSVLVAVHREALSRRGTLILTGVRPALDRLLALVALDRVLLTSPVTAGQN